MRIGIEASRVNNPGTGIDRHVRNLIEALGKVDSMNEYSLFSCDEALAEKLSLPGNFHIENPRKRFRMVYKRGFGIMGRILFRDMDVFHFPNSDVWYSKYAKTVVTLHDLAPFRFPERFFESRKAFSGYKRKMHYIKKNADRIIAVSRHAKVDISKYLGISSDKIDVVYNGIDNMFRPIEITDAHLDMIKSKFRIEGPFILFVGGMDFRKNINTLLAAFDILIKDKSIPHSLLVSGNPSAQGKLNIPMQEVLKNRNCQERVVFSGFTDDDDLLVLYNAADMLVHPSLFEGFGFPPLEAMACATPAIASNCASLPEILEDSALLIDPSGPEQLAKAMYEVITDSKKRERMIESGLRHVKKFNWEDRAKQTLDVYHRAVSRRYKL